MAAASDNFIVFGRGIEPGDTATPHPNLRNTKPRKATVAPVRRNGKELERVVQCEANAARVLVEERLAVP